MIYKTKIKLTSPILGQKQDGTSVTRIEKEGDNMILSKEVLVWAIKESLCLLQLDRLIDANHMVEILPIKRPAIVLYNRNYTDKISGTMKVRQFEAVRSGTVLTFELLVFNSLPRSEKDMGLRAPTEKEVKDVLSTIGKFFGISPYGSPKGYGRFDLIEFEPKFLNDNAEN